MAARISGATRCQPRTLGFERDAGRSANVMSTREEIYGIRAWHAWDEARPDNLLSYRQSPQESANDELVEEVTSFRELFRVVAFLNVMNKKTTLLFRGQTSDFEPRPTILRSRWQTPGFGKPVNPGQDLKYYWDELDRMCVQVVKILSGRLPRHRPFELFPAMPRLRVAPWSVVQHYELWPTPVIDLTSSLRVAASFALGATRGRREGYLYVYDLPYIVDDLMSMYEVQIEDPIVYRLSAVCPPEMDRPHLQEGFLFGNSLFNPEEPNDPAPIQLANRLVAKFRLVDNRERGRSQFWSSDFPKHSQRSLLPRPDSDVIKAMLDFCIRHDVVDGKATWSAV
jgi:hypothetical protein